MRVEEEFTIQIPVERMYTEMSKIGDIGYCIEGVKKVELLNETESRWVIEARAGFMARTFYLSGRIVERRPPHFVSFSGEGQDSRVSGFFELTAVGSNETRCRAVVDGEVTGPFAMIVDLMAKGPQKQIIEKTIANVRQRLEAVAAGAESEELRVGAIARAAARRSFLSALLSRLSLSIVRLTPAFFRRFLPSPYNQHF
jgi:carbon monoxide dehydrogenase subunit G